MPRPDHIRALHAALLTAARGLPVFPLSRTKLPAVRSPHRDEPRLTDCRGECGRPGHGVHDATTDPAAIRALFAVAPWATGYGIACGRAPHHLVGLDLDVKHGADGVAALHALAEAHSFEIPRTVTVLTPSGGRHLWLTAPGPVPNSVGRPAPGIDVRGAGGYVVGPGSRTVAGHYVLLPGTRGHLLAPAPPELLRLAAPPPAPPRGSGPPEPRHPAEKRAAGAGALRAGFTRRRAQRKAVLGGLPGVRRGDGGGARARPGDRRGAHRAQRARGGGHGRLRGPPPGVRRALRGRWECPEPDSNRHAPEGQRGLSSPCLRSTIRAGGAQRNRIRVGDREQDGKWPCCLILGVTERTSADESRSHRTTGAFHSSTSAYAEVT